MSRRLLQLLEHLGNRSIRVTRDAALLLHREKTKLVTQVSVDDGLDGRVGRTVSEVVPTLEKGNQTDEFARATTGRGRRRLTDE
jgi:hypothetical protein